MNIQVLERKSWTNLDLLQAEEQLIKVSEVLPERKKDLNMPTLHIY